MSPHLRNLRGNCLTAIALAAFSATAHAQFCFPFNCPGGSEVIDVSVATSASSYVIGDPILYSVIATNPASELVTLHFNTTRQADYIVDRTYSPDDIAGQAFTSRLVPANGSTTWKFRHPWDRYHLSAGDHDIVGEVVGYGHSEPAFFTVTAPAPVTDDVHMDFERYPNGTPTRDGGQLTYGLWSSAFIRNGVKFSSEGQGASVNLNLFSDNAVLYTPTISYPTGANIVAEFDMPVYTVSANVGSAVDRTVTMYAYDEDGELLGAVTSDPVVDFPNLAGKLSFDSEVAIASVQWFSSTPNAAVIVDDLFLNVDRAETHGDYNGDGQTNSADFLIWRHQGGQSVAPGFGADGNHDGAIDQSDYNLWRTNYGWSHASPPIASSVPEPTTCLLLGFIAFVRGTRRRRLLAASCE